MTVLTLTFFLILGKERYINAGIGLFPERHRPLVRRILKQSAGAVTGYVGGNLAISAICGVVPSSCWWFLACPTPSLWHSWLQC